MTAYSAMTVFIDTGIESTVHLAKRREDGLYVPQCGTRTRVKDLTVMQQSLVTVTCERCQKRIRAEGVQ